MISQFYTLYLILFLSTTTRYVIYYLFIYIYLLSYSNCYITLFCIKMKFNISIGDHHLGERTIPVSVSFDMKTRQFNFNTVCYVVEIDLLEVKCRMRSWIIRLLVPTFHSMRISFLNFLQHFV